MLAFLLAVLNPEEPSQASVYLSTVESPNPANNLRGCEE